MPALGQAPAFLSSCSKDGVTRYRSLYGTSQGWWLPPPHLHPEGAERLSHRFPLHPWVLVSLDRHCCHSCPARHLWPGEGWAALDAKRIVLGRYRCSLQSEGAGKELGRQDHPPQVFRRQQPLSVHSAGDVGNWARQTGTCPVCPQDKAA